MFPALQKILLTSLLSLVSVPIYCLCVPSVMACLVAQWLGCSIQWLNVPEYITYPCDPQINNSHVGAGKMAQPLTVHTTSTENWSSVPNTYQGLSCLSIKIMSTLHPSRVGCDLLLSMTIRIHLLSQELAHVSKDAKECDVSSQKMSAWAGGHNIEGGKRCLRLPLI